jgi:malonate-semialdehyde dehydrogenase (acetylating) / methylmalonate-semialdehyde dehydrogenase
MVTEVKQPTEHIVREVHNYIGGEWRRVEGPTEPVFNPATGEIIAYTPLSQASEVDRAVAAAAAAFPSWSSTPVAARTDMLFRFRALIHAHLDKPPQSLVSI